MVSVHPQSVELCGGTHTFRSGDIGLFKVTSESSIASGVRRMVAVTGAEAHRTVRDMELELRKAADLLKTSPREVVKRLETMQKRMKELEKKVEEAQLRAQASSGTGESLTEVAGMKVLIRRVDPADAKIFRGLADRYRDQLQSGVVITDCP